jgi:hypothetical protein
MKKVSQTQPFSRNILTAVYRRAALPEDSGNPLIEALPRHPERSDLMNAFGKYPIISDDECNFPAPVRMEAISRISNYLEPLPLHFDVAEKISLHIREGYRYRNPCNDNFHRDQVRLYREAMEGQVLPLLQSGPSFAPTFSLFGVSGVGKSSVIERTLSFLPQTLLHAAYKFVQIVWLKVDCPPDGSLKQLLYAILDAIDALIGTQYRRALRSKVTDALMIDVGRILHSHHLGMLVIDEIQHLLAASGWGQEKMQNFLVSFVNSLKIPLVVVGTTRAFPMMQATFRSARRVGDSGSIIWRQMHKEEEEWYYFLESLFKYQWTMHPVVLTKEISDFLHEITQGIAAIIVRLFQMSQFEAISSKVELLSPELFRKVASDNFQLIQPMLDAIRSGNTKLIDKYEDLMSTELLRLERKVDTTSRMEILREEARTRRRDAGERLKTVSALVAMSFSGDEVRPIVDKFFDENPEANSAQAIYHILSDLGPPLLSQFSQPFRSLRDIVDDGTSRGESALDALARAGLVEDPQKYR